VAHLHRLILAAALAVFSLLAHASVPTVQGWKWGGPAPVALYPDPLSACQARPTLGQWISSVSGPPSTVTGSQSDADCIDRRDGSKLFIVTKQGTTCPANSTLISGLNTCSCNPNFEDSADGKSCVPAKGRWEKACEANAGKRYNFQSAGKNQPGGCQTEINNVNSPIEGDTGGLPDSFGCQVRFVDDGSKTSALDPDTKEWVTKGLGRVTGETCVGTGVPVPSDAPEGTTQESEGKNDQCPYGLVKGVNGQIVCAYSDPNGTIEGTETSTVKNPDGTSTDTKKEIKCDGGVCTTTTTTTTRDSAGTIVGTKIDEKKESIGETCNKDPGNKVCATTGGGGGEGGAGFSGTCEAGFQVKGEDPIQNAMALEQYKRNCQFFEKKPDATDETRAYDDMLAKGKQGGDQTGDLPAGSKREVTIGPGDFDYSSAIGASQCFTDRSVQIWGRTVAIPLSIVCPWLEILGNILVVVGSLLAARIVVRG
jgi:hypothetical protein